MNREKHARSAGVTRAGSRPASPSMIPWTVRDWAIMARRDSTTPDRLYGEFLRNKRRY